MLIAILGAFLLGIIVWFLGSFFDTAPGNPRARLAGFIVFVGLVLLILANHYGTGAGL